MGSHLHSPPAQAGSWSGEGNPAALWLVQGLAPEVWQCLGMVLQCLTVLTWTFVYSPAPC
jgi:hypothetical protein